MEDSVQVKSENRFIIQLFMFFILRSRKNEW